MPLNTNTTPLEYTREAFSKLVESNPKPLVEQRILNNANKSLLKKDVDHLKTYFNTQQHFVFSYSNFRMLKTVAQHPDLLHSDELMGFFADISPLKEVYWCVSNMLLNGQEDRVRFLLDRVPDPLTVPSPHALNDGYCAVYYAREKIINWTGNKDRHNHWFNFLMEHANETNIHTVLQSRPWSLKAINQTRHIIEQYWSDKTKTVLIDAVKDIDPKLPHIKRKI